MFAPRRLSKELQKARQQLPPGIDLVNADNFQEWQLDIRVLDDTPLYQNQIFRLCFRFGNNYPMEPPEVTFLHVPASTFSPLLPASNTERPIPIHPDIFSNGIICIDLLSSAGWVPVVTVESICLSVQSMLTGNIKNERPLGDEYVGLMMGPRETWGDIRNLLSSFHDGQI